MINIFRKILLCISIILLFISLSSVVFVFIEASNYQLLLNNFGFQFFLSLFQPYLPIITTSIIVTTAYIAIETLKSHIEQLIMNKVAEEGKALLEIRILLNEKDNLEIHQNIRGNSGLWSNGIPMPAYKEPDTWRKIDNYLGILELINILINKNVISLESFNNQFGYRVDNVLKNIDIMSYLKGYTDEKGNSIWNELFDLFKKRDS